MFFLRYLRREIRSRPRQALVIALGLALGVGLVITVTAASAGVGNAQAGVLKGLYGVGTDVTVTKPPPPFNPATAGSAGGMRVTMGPDGKPQVCVGTHCSSGAQTIDMLTGPAYSPLSYSTLGSVKALHDVAAAGAGLVLTDRVTSIPANLGAGGGLPSSNSFDVDGVDFTRSRLGPLSDGTLAAGRNFAARDVNADVAVVDSDYAAANSLKAGSTLTVAKTRFTVIGLVSQPQAAKPPDVYIPLARAQALGTFQGKPLTGDVNAIYVTAASAADIGAVQKAISALLPSATITTPSSLASEVSGSLASTARLANDLGRWLAIVVLIAAFTVAALMTTAAVSRRVREFGTLKALGWRSGRIIAQVLGEAGVTGLAGAAAGVGLGFAGAAIIDMIAPRLSATIQTATGQHIMTAGPNGTQISSPTVAHTVAVPMSASVSGGAILLAVVLAIAGGVIAGIAASYQITRLRPADALARVA